jgi:phage terminase small subunit
MNLTPKQEAFALAIAAGETQAAAYRIAYPASLKWKDESVWQKASVLASNVNVRSRVEELGTKAAKANEITVERIVKELALIAFGNKRAVMSWGPNGVKLKDSEELTDEQAAQVAEVKETISSAGGSLSLKTHDKVKALELLGRFAGMFTDKVEVTGKGGAPLASAAGPDVIAALAQMSPEQLRALASKPLKE